MKRALCVWFPGRSSQLPNAPGPDSLPNLAEWCQRYSPFVSIAGDSLILDVEGDEPALLQQVRQDFQSKGLAVRLGLADTPGAAWAVAHFGRTRIVPSGETGALLPLPVEALRLSETALEALRAFDIRRVSQLAALPRSSLIRFGPEIIQRLEQAFGDQPELLEPVHLPQPVRAAFTFEDPPDRSTLEFVIDELVHKLTEQAKGITGVQVELDCGRSVGFAIGLVVPAPARHLVELIVTRLERLELPGELQSVRLTVAATMEARQPLLFGGQDFSRLVDRLCNRLGRERVTRPKLLPEAQPELAVLWEAVTSPDIQNLSENRVGVAGAGATRRPGERTPGLPFGPAPAIRLVCSSRSGSQSVAVTKLPRPLWLLKPEPIHVEWDTRIVRRREVYVIVGYWGPERIETGWWRHSDIRRDYFQVETDHGRFWLFRRVREEDWFLHGEFD
ncbi:MAG: DNA polymerase Y family protein [Planctomycetaceae bacterium]|nr:DNA polymerase Y family protein [Planctomycetaceae bacterium]